MPRPPPRARAPGAAARSPTTSREAVAGPSPRRRVRAPRDRYIRVAAAPACSASLWVTSSIGLLVGLVSLAVRTFTSALERARALEFDAAFCEFVGIDRGALLLLEHVHHRIADDDVGILDRAFGQLEPPDQTVAPRREEITGDQLVARGVGDRLATDVDRDLELLPAALRLRG